MIAALCPSPSRLCAAALACIAVALASPQAAHGDQASGRRSTALETAVIPPGQEDLFAAMLGRGAALPDACAFASGQIERTVVRGVYRCPDEVVLELRHPSDAPADAVRTAKVAIVPVRGTPPAALMRALEGRIRERENALEWPKVEKASRTRKLGCRSLAPLPSFLDPYFPGCYPLAAAVPIGIAQALVMVLGLGDGLRRLYRTSRSANGD